MAPRGAALTLLVLLAGPAAPEPRASADILRREHGDTFLLHADGGCEAARCAEFAAGAGAGAAGVAVARGECACACSARAPLFREDRALCVDDISECSLANFGTGPGAQKIPLVFLPLKGQIIHPSKDITFPGVKTPICAVSGAQFLTKRGFVDLRNTIDADVPFTLFRDEGRTFLQWSGEADLRSRMSGRVMLVRLLCRDVWAAPGGLEPPSVDLRGVFTPCVAFRVQGSPVQHINNVSEVQFALNASASESNTSGLSVSEYIAIGISSVLLGLIYVASVLLYLHIRKRRKRSAQNDNRRKILKGPKNKGGTSIREHDIIMINTDRVQGLPSTLDEAESGMVKSNPLHNMGRQFHDLKNYVLDTGSSHSDSEDHIDCIERDGEGKRTKNQFTSAIVHLNTRTEGRLRNDSFNEGVHRDESGIERLPDEHVSIVETTDSKDDKTDIVRPIGNTRRKLYFNPAYFEPDLMAEPPPAALEFLTKIREVITIAKHKMSAKRFQPVLNEIPEEDTYQSVHPSIDFYQGMGSQRSGSLMSLKRENSRKRSINCVGCPGCTSQIDAGLPANVIAYEAPAACNNCLNKSRGDKQSSIRKWLDEIPIQPNTLYGDMQSNAHQNASLLNSLLSLPTNDTRRKVRKPNSYCQSLYSEDVDYNFSFKKKTSSSSVRSEPIIRNYNFPLPEFENIQCTHNDIYDPSATASINSFKLRNYKPGTERPFAINQRRNKLITNRNSLPDMVSEAIAIDSSKVFNHSSSDEERVYNNKTDKKHQSRKGSASPQCKDYETDSLERNSVNKNASTDYEDEVPSSQVSPSLSVALPLEEELTMTNAVYKTHSNSNTPSPNIDTTDNNNHYETIGEAQMTRLHPPQEIETCNKYDTRPDDDYSLVSEVYVNNYNFGSPPSSPSGSECSMGSRKLSNSFNPEPDKPGCLTIIVQDSPENYIKIHESDGFEPDTLDRKHLKHKDVLELIQFSRKDLLNVIGNQTEVKSNQTIKLKSTGTFNKSESSVAKTSEIQFNSLRDVYESRNKTFTRGNLTDLFDGSKGLAETVTPSEAIDWNSEEGRILTLELRHSKRQRQCTPPSVKQLKSLVRPDVLPPLPPIGDSPIYEQPSIPPRKVESLEPVATKNVNSRSLSPSTFTSKLPADSTSKFRNKSLKGPDIPPGASVQMQYSDYENTTTSDQPTHNRNGKSSFRLKFDSNKYGNQAVINSNTYVKNQDATVSARNKHARQKVDSGYLSSDSTCSQTHAAPSRRTARLSGSESEDTENEARSESGAESIETHSVFFGSLRKFSLQAKESADSEKRSGFSRGNRKGKSIEKVKTAC